VFGVEALPAHWYNHIILGNTGCEQQIAHFQNSIRAVGRAGIPLLGYNWFLHGVWRAAQMAELRGGALGTAFRVADTAGVALTHGYDFEEEAFWANYRRFLEAVLPVAEAEGVTLALHPNDPPVEKIGGVPFLFRNRAAFRRAIDLRPSSNHGLAFCLGCWSEMGEDIDAAIKDFGAEGKLIYVHYQAVRGCVPEFHETFIDEGDYHGLSAWQVLNELHAAGFRGVMIPGHVPQLEGDVEWRPEHAFQSTPYKHPMGGYRARAYTIGYLKGMLCALEGMP
jgi:mannonate dehydratase